MPTPPTAATIPIFDAAQLNRHTRGNPRLQVEVLSLFLTEVERLMRQVESAPDPQLRAERLRALTSVARNTGAALIAQEARAMETEIAAEQPDLTPLRDAVAETFAFIRRTTG
jgi:HPt (histidine-containing phosphotransfer) domain-containing protein